MASITIYINDKCKRDALKKILRKHGWHPGERPEIFESETQDGTAEIREWIRTNRFTTGEQVIYTGEDEETLDLVKAGSYELSENALS